MGITQALNSKANVKKLTNQDLPFAPQQPVIASYYATSTAGQTIINLTFTVDTTNTDIFWLFVDGKKLDIGAANDYTMTAVAPDGTSSQVTLNQSLPVNLNIQAFKLGLKKESEFLTDNRFVQMYASNAAGFQSFVDPNANLIAPTATVGSPATGFFYSTITNRASMIDLSQDLKARMGMDRMMFQYLNLVQSEVGPVGEQIWASPNDVLGQIRFAGNIAYSVDSAGAGIIMQNPGDFIEITFYGTGLSLLTYPSTASEVLAASIDGNSITANIYSANNSVLTNRTISPNQVVPVVSGQTLGVHTVKLTRGGAVGVRIYGVDILNESSNVKVNAGVAYNQGKQLVNSAQSSFAYNSVATGTRGGRVLAYQKSDGTIAQAWQATGSQANLGSADHTNEDIARIYHWREFGQSQATTFTQDFETVGTGTQFATFTLEDGTTSLLGNSINNGTIEAIGTSTVGGFVQITFVGTGLDVVLDVTTTGSSASQTISVDGSAILTSTQIALNAGLQIYKIVSGLSYGTHTVKITKAVANGSWDFRIRDFMAYQPKKPTLPAGAIELADYNVMGNYTASAAGLSTVAGGVLRKVFFREFTYSGGGWAYSAASGDPTNLMNGQIIETSTNGAVLDMYFFGTGFEMRTFAGVATGRSSSILVSMQNLTTNGSLLSLTTANFPGTTFAVTGGSSFTTGTLNNAAVAGSFQGSSLQATGLSLGWYKLRFTNNAAADMNVECLDWIAPIHSYKMNLVSGQNTNNIGSQGISDNRKFSPLKEAPSLKAWAQGAASTTSPTTTSTTAVPMPDMSCTVKTSGGPIRIAWEADLANNILGAVATLQLFIDGVAAGNTVSQNQFVANNGQTYSGVYKTAVGAGVHKVDLFWSTNTGTLTAAGVRRNIIVEET